MSNDPEFDPQAESTSAAPDAREPAAAEAPTALVFDEDGENEAGFAIVEDGQPVECLSDEDLGARSPVAEEATRLADEQAAETEAFAVRFLRKVLRLKVVRIDREHFLTTELRNKGIDDASIVRAIEDRPAAAGIPARLVDQLATEAISLEVKQATSASFVSGLPGGWAIVATVPADLTQYYAHVFRLIQKLAYLYGWSSFFDELDEVSDETLYRLLMFFSVSMKVEGAGTALSKFAVQVAEPAVAKHVAAKALAKTAWYLPVKKALNFVGVSITKNTVGKAAGRIVPVVGGVVSGGITFVTLRKSGKRLKEHLATLPQADPNMPARAHTMAAKLEAEEDTVARD